MIARDQTFEDMEIYLDGSSFYNCTFKRCRFIYSGVVPATIAGGFNMVDCQWAFAGPANNMIQFMSGMYKAGVKEMVEHMIANIRGEATNFGAPVTLEMPKDKSN
jgi:hypothetical protein